MAKTRVGSGRTDPDPVMGSRGEIVAAVTPRSPAQQAVVNTWQQSRILFLLGPAGTGKSHIALALALIELLRMPILPQKQKPRLLLSRPTVAVEESLGFFPGTLEEKMGPWTAAFHDVYGEACFARWEQLKQEIEVELVPVGMLRGRTVRNGVLLIDECQSLTEKQIKCALSRLGPNSKIVLSGDTDQSDRYSPKQSPLLDAVRKLDQLKPQVATVRFGNAKKDQLRDPLVSDILDLL